MTDRTATHDVRKRLLGSAPLFTCICTLFAVFLQSEHVSVVQVSLAECCAVLYQLCSIETGMVAHGRLSNGMDLVPLRATWPDYHYQCDG